MSININRIFRLITIYDGTIDQNNVSDLDKAIQELLFANSKYPIYIKICSVSGILPGFHMYHLLKSYTDEGVKIYIELQRELNYISLFIASAVPLANRFVHRSCLVSFQPVKNINIQKAETLETLIKADTCVQQIQQNSIDILLSNSTMTKEEFEDHTKSDDQWLLAKDLLHYGFVGMEVYKNLQLLDPDIQQNILYFVQKETLESETHTLKIQKNYNMITTGE